MPNIQGLTKVILDPDANLHRGNATYTLVMKFYKMGPYIYSQLNEGRKMHVCDIGFMWMTSILFKASSFYLT